MVEACVRLLKPQARVGALKRDGLCVTGASTASQLKTEKKNRKKRANLSLCSDRVCGTGSFPLHILMCVGDYFGLLAVCVCSFASASWDHYLLPCLADHACVRVCVCTQGVCDG